MIMNEWIYSPGIIFLNNGFSSYIVHQEQVVIFIIQGKSLLPNRWLNYVSHSPILKTYPNPVEAKNNYQNSLQDSIDFFYQKYNFLEIQIFKNIFFCWKS